MAKVKRKENPVLYIKKLREALRDEVQTSYQLLEVLPDSSPKQISTLLVRAGCPRVMRRPKGFRSAVAHWGPWP